MLIRIVFLAAGLFIGWNLPQPPWAITAQEKAITAWKAADLPTSVEELKESVDNKDK